MMSAKWFIQTALFCGFVVFLFLVTLLLLVNYEDEQRQLEQEGDIDKIMINV